MTYNESIAWLYSTQTVGIKLGLENISRLLHSLDVETKTRPGTGPGIFHVAGTNGKGSVCAMLDAICRADGKRTALFTSPHLVTFRERIRINGAMISEEAVAQGLSRIRSLIADWQPHPTFFEIATALALAWFRDQRAEVIVLETGLGGRLDATNAVTPAVAVITALSLDHRQYLGNTLDEIAAEKAGIFKPGIPAISQTQPPEAARVLENTAAQTGTPLTWITQPVPFTVALPGSHQKLNAALAVAALQAAHIPVSQAAIESGLKQVVWPGRFQQLQSAQGIPLVLDGAHNEAAAARLVQTWREVHGNKQAVILLGILRDKDVSSICRELAPLAAVFVVTPAHNVRSCTAGELAQAIRAAAPLTPCIVASSAAEGFALAQAEGRKLQLPVLVTGSLFLIGETLALISGGKAESSAQ